MGLVLYNMVYFSLYISVLQWTILVLARPSALPPIETITLKCQPNTQGYPITLEMAKMSHFLKSSTSEVVVLGTNDCEKGLPIIVKVLNGGILTMTRENFGYIFPLASQLDLLLHKECIRFFLDHSDLIHEMKDQNARDELETLLTVREKLESLGYNDWKRDLMDDNKLDLGSAISCAVENVEWLTNALNSGSLRHLEVLSLDGDEVGAFSLSPIHPLRLKSLILACNRISDVNQLIQTLNECKLPQLESLSLNENQIATFPLSPKQPLKIKYLSLDENLLSDAEAIAVSLNEGMLPDLETLILQNNKITSFILAPRKPLCLRQLTLAFNQLKNVDSMVHALGEGKLPLLQWLLLHNNMIKRFPLAYTQEAVSHLKYLALNDNQITDILPIIIALNSGKFDNMYALSLHENHIYAWDPWYILDRMIPNLEVIEIDFYKMHALDDINPLVSAYNRGAFPMLDSSSRSRMRRTYRRLRDSVIYLTLNRKDVYRSAKAKFLILTDLNFRQIKIKYKGEIGIDEGGLTRDFVHHLSQEMVKPGHGIFQVINQEMVNDEDKRARPLYYFAENNDAEPNSYLFIGRFLAFAYLKKVPLSVEFAPIFYSLLIDSDMPLQFEDLKTFDMALYNGLNNMKGQSDALSQFSFCINDTPISDIYGCDVPVTIENQNDYFNAFANFMIKKKYKEAIKAISSAFLHYFEIYCTPLSLEKLMKTLIPTSNIDVSELIAHTKFKEFAPEEAVKMKTFYSEILNEWNQTIEGKERIESLVIFIRGSKLPMTGWMGVPNIIFHKDVSSYLPVAHTCFSSLHICFYATKEEFLNAINSSLEYFIASGGAMALA